MAAAAKQGKSTIRKRESFRLQSSVASRPVNGGGDDGHRHGKHQLNLREYPRHTLQELCNEMSISNVAMVTSTTSREGK